MKHINRLISFIVSVLFVLVPKYWDTWISALVGLYSQFVESRPKIKEILLVMNSLLPLLLRLIVVYLIVNWITKLVARVHFKHSLSIVLCKMLPTMKDRVWRFTRFGENRTIDSFIQSPMEYVNEIVKGNQVPQFNPDDTYQDVLYDDNKPDDKRIKYIVAITAENPNMFLDPTIGFYMSNCYAASLIRHTNDFIKTKSKPNSIPQLRIRDLDDLESVIVENRKKIIEKLKEGSDLEKYEFVRVFMYDENQKKCCDNAIFPSLKASQDLFRTVSFYIQKEEIEKNLKSKKIDAGSDKNNWEKLKRINNKLWSLFDDDCKTNKGVKKVQKNRIKKIVPEFLFVFYKNEVEIHSYLGGKYCKNRYSKVSDEGESIKELIKLLAEYINSNDDFIKGDLKLGKQENKYNTFIDWEWV